MTKTLYITNFGLLDTLASTQIVPYIKGFADNGIKVFVISYEKIKNLKNQNHYECLRRELELKNIEWDYLIYHRRWGNIWDIINGLYKVILLTITKNIDVLHARASIPVLISLPVAKIFGKKLLYDRRGTMAGDFSDDIDIQNIFSISSFLYKFIDILDRLVIKFSDGVVILSNRAKDILMQDSFLNKKNKYAVIPCCVDMERFNINSASDNRYEIEGENHLCYLGSLGTCYLFDKMIDFFKVWKEYFKSAKFIIISQTEKDFIVKELQKSGVHAGDTVVLKVPPQDIVRYLVISRTSIMFIKQVECKIGSSPTKFAESLAAGIPICINKGIGDSDKFITDGQIGVIINEFNDSSYKKAIEQLNSLYLDRALSSRCQKFAKDYFSLEKGVAEYINIYKNLKPYENYLCNR